jgi:hypothetical protein
MASYFERGSVTQIDIDDGDIDAVHVDDGRRRLDGACRAENNSSGIGDTEAYFLGLQKIIFHNKDAQPFKQSFVRDRWQGGAPLQAGTQTSLSVTDVCDW